MSDNNDPADKGRGTTRRAFLGAASALGALAATGTSTATTDDQDTDDAATFSADLEVWGEFNDPADYEFRASKLADEYNDVTLRIPFGNATVRLAFTREEAEAFADELVTAARRGEDGLGK